MAEEKQTPRNKTAYLKSEDLQRAQACPGYAVIEMEDRPEERKSAGGIVLPVIEHEKKTEFEMGVARIVSCGPYYTQQSGMVEAADGALGGSPRLRWPLPAGTRVLFHPHSPWPLITDDGRRFYAIKCVDVMAVLP